MTTITIIDNTPTRSSKIKNCLSKLPNIEVNVCQEIDDNNLSNSPNSLLYLVHKGNHNIEKFVNRLIAKDVNCFIFIFSGGGIKQRVNGIVLNERIFYVNQVFNRGDETNVIELLTRTIRILCNSSSTPIQLNKLAALFGFDMELEELLQPFTTADATNENKSLKLAKEALQDYVNEFINHIDN